MNVETTDFQPYARVPSPVPTNLQPIVSFGVPAQLNATGSQYTPFHPASSSIESFESSGSFYSRPLASVESTGSRTVGTHTFSKYMNLMNILYRVGLRRM